MSPLYLISYLFHSDEKTRHFIVCSPAVVGAVTDFITLPPTQPADEGALTAITGDLLSVPRVLIQPSRTTATTTARMPPGSQIISAARKRLAAKNELLLLNTAEQLRESKQELVNLSNTLYAEGQAQYPATGGSEEAEGKVEDNEETEVYMVDTSAIARSPSPVTPPYSPMVEGHTGLTYGEAHTYRTGAAWSAPASGAESGSGNASERSLLGALGALANVIAENSPDEAKPPAEWAEESTEYRIPPSHWKRREAVVCHTPLLLWARGM